MGVIITSVSHVPSWSWSWLWLWLWLWSWKCVPHVRSVSLQFHVEPHHLLLLASTLRMDTIIFHVFVFEYLSLSIFIRVFVFQYLYLSIYIWVFELEYFYLSFNKWVFCWVFVIECLYLNIWPILIHKPIRIRQGVVFLTELLKIFILEFRTG